MDKKELKAKLKQERTDKQREIDRMKYTHEWVSEKQWNAGRTRMQNVNVHCKKCGMGFWNFRVMPMTCNEAAVYDVITNTAAPAKPPLIIPSQVGQVIGIPTGGLGGKGGS